MSIIYGPVPSWRLGKSLGIDMVSTRFKTCSFNCIYCQLGDTINKQSRRQEFVKLDRVRSELDALPRMDCDYATFSGIGEPTLASNIGEAIRMVQGLLQVPVAVLTNSTLLPDRHVRQELAAADFVVAKLDAPDNETLHMVNRPEPMTSVQDIVTGIKEFRSIFAGKLAIQIMFIESNSEKAMALAETARQLNPDEVQINTPLRPCKVKPLSADALVHISSCFSGCRKVINVYESPRAKLSPLNSQETRRRRPEKDG